LNIFTEFEFDQKTLNNKNLYLRIVTGIFYVVPPSEQKFTR